MTDILFNELGAAVTQILGPNSCTIEPFYNSAPTYNDDPEKRYTVEFTKLLDLVGPTEALYDTIVSPMTGRRVAIGPHWPGGGYEGILCVRDDVVQNNPLLKTAWEGMGMDRYKYQVIAAIDGNGTVLRRYHGFHAVVVLDEGEIKLKIGNCQISYNENDENLGEKFYAGLAFNGSLVTANLTEGNAGPVFVNLSEFNGSGLEGETDKLPLSAGL